MMVRWLRKVDFGDVWGRARDGEVSLVELAGVVVVRLRGIVPIGDVDVDYELGELIDEFVEFVECGEDDCEWFDDIWERLYNWGDCGNVCWINTLRSVKSGGD